MYIGGQGKGLGRKMEHRRSRPENQSTRPGTLNLRHGQSGMA